jgi:hypothetical protein
MAGTQPEIRDVTPGIASDNTPEMKKPQNVWKWIAVLFIVTTIILGFFPIANYLGIKRHFMVRTPIRPFPS